MTGRVEGKVAFIAGAARGQGRSHAIRLAQEGADIIAVDICETIPEVAPFYPGATPDDLAERVRQVEALDRRIVATRADVRDYDALMGALDAGLNQLGRIDISPGQLRAPDVGQPADDPERVAPQAVHTRRRDPTQAQAEPIFTGINSLPVPWVDPVDISNAILFRASDEARYVTGLQLTVDVGYTTK